MNKLLFKNWLLNEIADYGFGPGMIKSIRGGTLAMQGQELFNTINVNQIIDELARMPLGQLEPYQKWAETVQYGKGIGAFKVSVSPLGSLKAVSRRLVNDLKGEGVWICKHVFPFCDNKDQNRENEIAGLIFNYLNEISQKELEGPSGDYDDIKNLSWRLWQGAKKHHPGYIMFPTQLKEMSDSYYKLVFEFRGQGIGLPNQGRGEQFNIDIKYYKEKGLIRCWGYDIDSSAKQRKWEVKPPEWDEWFSPTQEQNEIIESILACFLQY
jgi:hypothetical protein